MKNDPGRRRRWVASYSLSLILHGLVLLAFLFVSVDVLENSTEVAAPGDVTVISRDVTMEPDVAPAPAVSPAPPVSAAVNPSPLPARTPAPAPLRVPKSVRAPNRKGHPQIGLPKPAAEPSELARNVRAAAPQSRRGPVSDGVRIAIASPTPMAAGLPLPLPPAEPRDRAAATALPAPTASPASMPNPQPSLGKPIAVSAPSAEPARPASAEPSVPPTMTPTSAPSPEPTAAATPRPTAAPTERPTAAPSPRPTAAPSPPPTAAPTLAASPTPTPIAAVPTAIPSSVPTAEPSAAVTAVPTRPPTVPQLQSTAVPAAALSSPAAAAQQAAPASPRRQSGPAAGAPAPSLTMRSPSAARPGESAPARALPRAASGSPAYPSGTGAEPSLNERLKHLDVAGNVDYAPKRVALGSAQGLLNDAVAAYDARLAPPPDILRRTFGYIYERRSATRPDSLAYVYETYKIGPITMCKAWKIIEHPYVPVYEVGAVARNAGIGGAVVTNDNSPVVRHDNGGAAELTTVQFPCSERSYSPVAPGSITTPLPRHPDLSPHPEASAALP